MIWAKNMIPKNFWFDAQRNMPITSCLNAENYKEYFEPFFKNGEDILYVSFSSKMSGTFTFLDIAIKELSQQYPDAKFTRFDTKGISMSAGISVYYAAKMYKEGKSFEEIIKFLERFVPKVNMAVTPKALFILREEADCRRRMRL